MKNGAGYDPYQDPNMVDSPGDDQDEHYDGAHGSNDSDTATKKLVGSRHARKRAEEDVKLLQNRILLLKMEEKKVNKFKFLLMIHLKYTTL